MEIIYYYVICICIRLSFAYLTYVLYNKSIRYTLITLFFIISIGELYQYIMKTRTIGAFNNRVWWDSLRPIHTLLFFCTSLSLFYKYKYSYLILLLDTIISVLGYILIKPKLIK